MNYSEYFILLNQLHSLMIAQNILEVFTSTGVTGYKGIRVTFLRLNTLQKVTLIPLYPITPVLVNTPIVIT